MQRYVLALDLIDHPESIAAYEAHHKAVWPAVLASIQEAGIAQMWIYRFGNRLTMIMEVESGFSFARKADQDQHNPQVQAWESLMSRYQRALPGAAAGEKWVLMDEIFNLNKA